jgi:hypothetical protein
MLSIALSYRLNPNLIGGSGILGSIPFVLALFALRSDSKTFIRWAAIGINFIISISIIFGIAVIFLQLITKGIDHFNETNSAVVLIMSILLSIPTALNCYYIFRRNKKLGAEVD